MVHLFESGRRYWNSLHAIRREGDELIRYKSGAFLPDAIRPVVDETVSHVIDDAQLVEKSLKGDPLVGLDATSVGQPAQELDGLFDSQAREYRPPNRIVDLCVAANANLKGTIRLTYQPTRRYPDTA